jgi:hypothetical protein
MYISVPGWTINAYCNVKLKVTIVVLPLFYSLLLDTMLKEHLIQVEAVPGQMNH